MSRIRDGIECSAVKTGDLYRPCLTLRYNGRTMHETTMPADCRSRGDAVLAAQSAASYVTRCAFDIGQTIYDLAPATFAQWAQRSRTLLEGARNDSNSRW